MSSFIAPNGIPQNPSQYSFGRVARRFSKITRQWKRRRLRRRVALTVASPDANQKMPFSPHCLTSHEHLLMAICSAKSLNLVVEQALPWVFHDDGSLTAADKQLLLAQFPGCHLVERTRADEFFKTPQLAAVAEARQKSVLLLKVADLHVFARHERILYVDSDVLFFKRPDALFYILEHEKGNYFSKDIDTAYIAKLETLKELTGVQPLDRVNSGIFVLNRSDIALDKVAQTLSAIDAVKSSNRVLHHHLIEQTLVAILATDSKSGAAHLPAEYDLYLERGLNGAICRHYVGVIREFFELEGLQTLLRERDFLRRWRELPLSHSRISIDGTLRVRAS